MISDFDLNIVGPALLAGMLVLSTHVPLGRRVLERGIIFIDLAIAQGEELGIPMWVCQAARLVFKHAMFQGAARHFERGGYSREDAELKASGVIGEASADPTFAKLIANKRADRDALIGEMIGSLYATDIVAALNASDVRERMKAIGQELSPSTSEQFQEQIRNDYALWGKVVRASGAKAD